MHGATIKIIKVRNLDTLPTQTERQFTGFHGKEFNAEEI
jgi:hypothetical protein